VAQLRESLALEARGKERILRDRRNDRSSYLQDQRTHCASARLRRYRLWVRRLALLALVLDDCDVFRRKSEVAYGCPKPPP
jgi:hypothetical protein